MKTLYVDVHKAVQKGSKNNKNEYVVFGGFEYFKVKKLTEILAEVGDELTELVGRGVEVWALRRLTDLKKIQEWNNLPKAHKGDTKALSLRPKHWFAADTLLYKAPLPTVANNSWM